MMLMRADSKFTKGCSDKNHFPRHKPITGHFYFFVRRSHSFFHSSWSIPVLVLQMISRCTGPPDRMSHRKWRSTKQHPTRARAGWAGYQISCCLLFLHFLCDILSGGPVFQFWNAEGQQNTTELAFVVMSVMSSLLKAWNPSSGKSRPPPSRLLVLKLRVSSYLLCAALNSLFVRRWERVSWHFRGLEIRPMSSADSTLNNWSQESIIIILDYLLDNHEREPVLLWNTSTLILLDPS